MATVSAVVYEHHRKMDGTYNVKIRIFHRNEKRLMDTIHFVTEKQLDRKLKIKDKFIKKRLDQTLEEYREAISSLGAKLTFFTAADLRDYLKGKDKEVDFIKFCSQHIDHLRVEKRNGTANNHRTVRNSLIDYFRRGSVSINEINSNMLLQYERFLRSERNLKRINQLGKEVITKQKGLSDSGVHNHMRDLRTLFNAACKFHNNDDLGIYKIKHYPFKKYKIGSSPLTPKRNITLEELKMIRDCKVKERSRAELARDLFMLSFYLCGMNAVDFYNLRSFNSDIKRLEYK